MPVNILAAVARAARPGTDATQRRRIGDMAETPPEQTTQVPSELPVLPLRNTVAFPFTVAPLVANRPASLDAINRALSGNRMILMLLQNSPSEELAPDDLRQVGTVGVIRQMVKAPMGTSILVEGLVRARAASISQSGVSLTATVEPLPEPAERSVEIDAYVRRLRDLVDRLSSLASGGWSQELHGLVMGIDDPVRLCYVLVSLLDMKADDKQKLLEENRLEVKLNAAAAALGREVTLLELKGRIETAAEKEMSDAQRQYFLRQQLKAIQQELGEGDGSGGSDIRDQIEKANLPDHVKTVADREIGRLDQMTPASPEYQMIRTYLDWICEVPWSTVTEDRLDPTEARRTLDEDHYDLDKVKDRIVEYLAVRKLKGDMKGPILCFVGAPGVGKTSLGHSIARAMNRKFVRVSLGGVRDEAEIRGHRRTYIGAMPGRIVLGLKQGGSANPVFMLDEIDKISVGYQGDPAAALLEVLDPAQNNSFRDHYLEIPFDLSRVLFIATANQLGTVHPALQDRMEVINLAGYTEEDKLHIANRYLIPRQISEHGLPADAVTIDEPALRILIGDYTREAGVRNLERQIGTIARKIAARVAARPEGEGPAAPAAVGPDQVREFLGAPRFHKEVAFRTSRPGVATGVAWTETGGDVLFVEATLLPGGHEHLVLTGQLGDVMQESARAALSHVRANAEALGIQPDFLDKHDLHVHVPAGAIPKDGPSAGVTMATAILSAVKRQPVRNDLAMTGEITLSGLVLPVGGIREKALAARRQGIKTFVLPAQNRADVEELPPEVRNDMRFVPVETVEELFAIAFAAN
jgi:ATP-dependent Lon protease